MSTSHLGLLNLRAGELLQCCVCAVCYSVANTVKPTLCSRHTRLNHSASPVEEGTDTLSLPHYLTQHCSLSLSDTLSASLIVL